MFKGRDCCFKGRECCTIRKEMKGRLPEKGRREEFTLGREEFIQREGRGKNGRFQGNGRTVFTPGSSLREECIKGRKECLISNGKDVTEELYERKGKGPRERGMKESLFED